jgi:DNA-binding transcriptional LysR family regulator
MPLSLKGNPVTSLRPGRDELDAPELHTGRGTCRSNGAHGQSSINLASVDLNLLVALEALLDQRNVTRAANAVGLSQPAMSRALSRLRGMFNDELLVRTPAGYVLTVRGEQLQDRLPTTLNSIREIVASRLAGSDIWLSTFRLAMPDHQALVLLNVLDRLNSEADSTKVMVEPLTPNHLRQMENGELEIAVGQIGTTSSGFYQRTLYKDQYACLLRNDHPALDDRWSAERFLDLRHAVIAPGYDSERGFAVDALELVAPRQRCVLSPNMMGTAMAVADSDMALTVPGRVAFRLASLLPLRVVQLPVEAEPYEVVMLWHERSHRDVNHAAMRAQIADTSACLIERQQ